VTTETTRLLGISEVALRVGVPEWRLRQLADAGRVPCGRLGRMRVFDEGALPAIRAAAAAAGFVIPTAGR
jgi:hypothetical protein